MRINQFAMTKVSSIQAWIDAGYVLFSENGLEAIQIEPLSRAIGLNKSGFYHYFGDRESFLEAIMEHHMKHAKNVTVEYSQMKQLLPDMVDILMRYRLSVMVHMQLVRNKHNAYLFENYNKINAIVDQSILPCWAEYTGLSNNLPVAMQYLQMVRDMFYARITPESFTAEFLSTTLKDAGDFVRDLRQKEKPVV
jgi:AcrR family transcriptional regulator